MMMTCREVRDFLVDYISGELDSVERLELEQHLNICQACANCVETGYHMRLLSQSAIAQLDPPSASDVPESLLRAIKAAGSAYQEERSAMTSASRFAVLFSDVPIRL